PATSFLLPQNITYTYSFRNTGNVTLAAPYTVVDDKIPSINCSGATGNLAPGASKSCLNSTYSVTQADLDAGSIVNRATASAMFGTQGVPSAEVSTTVITYTGTRLGLKKSASPSYFTGPGQTLTYTFTLMNTGGVTLKAPYSVTDPLISGGVDCSAAASTLPVGGSTSCSGTYPVTPDDNVAGSILNSATATATDSANGATVPSTLPSPATLTVNKFVCDSSTLKHAGPIPSGSDVPWTIINNTGIPVHIASIMISWDNGPSLTQVLLQGFPTPIWNGPTTNSNGGFTLPGGPWTLGTGSTIMQLKFSVPASGTRVYLTFTEQGCPPVDSSIPPS
ncbi:MAG: hypothetical protein V1755_10380, partial [Chloroflexota bacterium]